MDFEFKQGLNLLNYLLDLGFKTRKSDELECISYNVNLNLAIRLFSEYPHIRKIIFHANSQNFSISTEQRGQLLKLIESEKIVINHISRNELCIHSKVYRFKKDGNFTLGAITSANFSENSNLNFESMYISERLDFIEDLGSGVAEKLQLYEIKEKKSLPESIVQILDSDRKIDKRFVEGLWVHQQAILEWLALRRKGIVNIPPGCGKSRIAIRYIQYLFNRNRKTTVIILVPTITLINQWKQILKNEGIDAFEVDMDMNNIGQYFANPTEKVIITLYSRFFEKYPIILQKISMFKPDLLTISDECHNLYSSLEDLERYYSQILRSGTPFKQSYFLSLSATIDSFIQENVDRFIALNGGEQNRFSISIPSFYSYWNNLNKTPCLKPIMYQPLYYNLSLSEMQKYLELSRFVGIESQNVTLQGDNSFDAAIRRAQYVRGLEGSYKILKSYIQTHIEAFNRGNTIIFVPTHEFAEELRTFLVNTKGWNPKSSAYVYDSKKSDMYLQHALEQFKNNLGFCLISEIMLSEGFDIPVISRVVLHGSHKSQRDWIQKIGRAIRFDPTNESSLAEVIDLVFCNPTGKVLPIEEERYETLKSISK
ncbi:type III restriction enzyme, res subunit [Methanoregula boonei 6A8]|jgi:superfamily II DNA or RNA helicase|uniref:Type III restriction enzyme, res subunit n=1 Tax=Methanoregula boonei (strain DSM 21154 / JCM 14090 / 6A8) TaxID=456442 RepID=A7I564_METB6|nr:DEAD/DEAH box helicase family protein [Methanoregula boonei]ABS54875.1 type III restriction enzyme, res subunit [Methanoregula boonei 6A8]